MCASGRPPCETLEAAIEQLAAEDLSPLSPATTGASLQLLFRLRARLDSELSRRVGHFDDTQGHRADGSLDTAAWLRLNCHLSPGAAADHVRVARAGAIHEPLRLALAKGDISHHHAAVIARAGQEVGVAAAQEIAPKLLALAPELDPSSLRVVAKQEQARVQPDALLKASNRDHQRGYLHLSPLDNGMFSINGLADHERARLLEQATSPYMHPLDAIDDRTTAQRRLDALVEVARYRLEGGSDSSGRTLVGGQRPHLTLVVDVDTLRQRGDGVAALNGVAVPAETARRLACDAARTVHVVDQSGDVLDVGRTSYTVPAPLRRAVCLRDQVCRFPGCQRPVAWCDQHHYQHWIEGGKTAKENIGSLCRPHHRLVHEGGWNAQMLPDGSVAVTSPEGLVLRQDLDGRVTKSWPQLDAQVERRAAGAARLGDASGIGLDEDRARRERPPPH